MCNHVRPASIRLHTYIWYASCSIRYSWIFIYRLKNIQSSSKLLTSNGSWTHNTKLSLSTANPTRARNPIFSFREVRTERNEIKILMKKKTAKIYQNTKFSLVIQAETLSHRKWTKWRRKKNSFFIEIWYSRMNRVTRYRISFAMSTRQSSSKISCFSSFIFIHINNKSREGEKEYDRKLSLCRWTFVYITRARLHSTLCTPTPTTSTLLERQAKNISVHTTISLHHGFSD